MSSDSDELDPDEPRTPMWLPLLGSALFLVALMLFLATRSDDDVKAEPEPSDTEQVADGEGDEADDDQGDGDQGDDEHAGHNHPPKPRRDALRAAPRGGKMVPTPAPSIRVRRID